MAKTSMKKRAVVIGIILGLAVASRKWISSLWRSANQTGPGMGAVAPGDIAGHETVSRQESGETGDQHEDRGEIPSTNDANSLLMGGSAASEDAELLAGASAYSSESGPYDADISDEGVTLTYHDPTDREEDVPLDEGIPNLGEPVDVADVGPETPAQEAIVEDVEPGVPEEYGEDQPIDSVEHEDAWVVDAAGEGDEIPAASRGLREFGEGGEGEMDIEDAEDTEGVDLYEDVEPSGAGGEVDLENDEAPQAADEGFSIVSDPNDPLSADEGGTIVDPLEPEETLGLRDSESEHAPLSDQDSGGGRSNLGMTGDYDEAVETQRVQASPGEADTSGDAGADRQASFATGGRGHEGVDDTGIDRAMEDQEFGDTGEFGAPSLSETRMPEETGETDRSLQSPGARENVGPDTGEAPEGEKHLGVSGDFEQAEDTENVPAKPSDGDETSEGSDRESYVTGDDGDRQEPSASQGDAGYSAAWSTPAGVVGEWPNQETTVSGSPGEDARASGTDTGEAEQTAAETSDTTPGRTAGESGQIVSQAKDRAGLEMTSSHDTGNADREEGVSEEYPGDPSGGDQTDMAAAAAGDLGDRPSYAGGSRRQGDRDPFEENPASGGAEDAATSNAPGAPEDLATAPAPRKSRKQRRMEATDWVPAGAVKGDGTANCPADYPIKGNANSRIYHRPEDPSYPPTIPEYCFATEDDAKHAGFRAPKG